MKLFILASLLIQMAFSFPFNKSSNVLTSHQDSSIQNKSGLTDRIWQMQEIRFLQNNIPYYYHRDDRGKNTIDFDNDFIQLNADGTGLYHQSDGTDFQLSWHSKNESLTSIEYTIKNFRANQDLVVTWEHIEFINEGIRYTEYYQRENGVESLGVATRVCKTGIEEAL